ncbi:uncharacterized protein [Ptychodera flava]|uniref:uncharacterized protein isoform X2 n=1 Tax=Ptychodera flava TaxID=63121 RepID=UPI00396A6B00
MTSVEVTITPKKSGVVSADVHLSGSSATDFKKPPPLSVDVQNSFEKFAIDDYTIPKGCHTEQLSQCPDNPQISPFLSSTSQWYQLKGNDHVFFTYGIAFVNHADFSIPLSMKGVQVVKSSDGTFRLSSVSSRMTPDMGMGVSDHAQCNEIPVTTFDMQEFVQTSSFSSTYLNSMDRHLPNWISLIYTEYGLASQSSITSKVLKGYDINLMSPCHGAPIVDDDLYSAFTFNRQTQLSVLGDKIALPESNDPDQALCLLISLCDPNTAIMMFPPDSTQGLKRLEIVRVLQSNGFDVETVGLGFSSEGKLRKDDTEITLWNGDHSFTYSQPDGYNLWLEAQILRDTLIGSTGDLFNVSINGRLVFMLAVQDLDQVLSHLYQTRIDALVSFESQIDIELSFQALGLPVTLQLTGIVSAGATAYLSLGGTDREWCGPDADPPGFFANVWLHVSPFGNEFFDKLFSAHGAGYLFINYDVTQEMNTMSKYPMLQIIQDAFPEARLLSDTIRNFQSEINEETDPGYQRDFRNLREMTETLILKIQNASVAIAQGSAADIPNILSPIKRYITTMQGVLQSLKSQTTGHNRDAIVDIERSLRVVKDRVESSMHNYVLQVLNIPKPVSGFGLRFEGELKIKSLKVGAVEVEFVLSENVGRCSRFSDVYDLLGEGRALRGLISLKRRFNTKFKFVKASKGCGWRVCNVFDR